VLSATEAARACGVSLRTMSRRLNSGQVPGAERDGNAWRVPVEGLIAAGFQLYRSQPVEPDPATGYLPGLPGPAQLQAQRVAELEQQLRDEQHRRELAETRERGLERLVEQLREDLDYQRSLMPGPAPEDVDEVHKYIPSPEFEDAAAALQRGRAEARQRGRLRVRWFRR